MINSYGELPIISSNFSPLFIIALRFPQAIVETKNPTISISSLLWKRWIRETGSSGIKFDVLNSETLKSKKSFNSSKGIDIS